MWNKFFISLDLIACIDADDEISNFFAYWQVPEYFCLHYTTSM